MVDTCQYKENATNGRQMQKPHLFEKNNQIFYGKIIPLSPIYYKEYMESD